MNTFGLYPNGNKVTEKPEILFARMDIKDVMEKVEAMKAAAAAEKQEEKKEEEKPGMDVEKKPEITYDDFAKLQFQIGEIVKCEEVPKSKKLLCSQVKIGSETRQILSGIKAWYKTGRYGRQKGYGRYELKTGEARRHVIGRHDPLRGGMMRATLH